MAGIEGQAGKDIEQWVGVDIERRVGLRVGTDLPAVELGMIQRVAAGVMSPYRAVLQFLYRYRSPELVW